MTNLKQCIAAWQALRALAAQAMDYKSAHALVLLMERLRPHVAYFSSTETELVKNMRSSIHLATRCLKARGACDSARAMI